MTSNNTFKKFLALILSLVVFLCMLNYLIFEASHEIHDCTGEHCPVCHELHIIDNCVKQFGAGILMITVCIFTAIVYSKVVIKHFYTFLFRNLILDKVRLDD